MRQFRIMGPSKKPSTPATGGAVVRKIRGQARTVKDKILKRQKPTLEFPVRSVTNVVYRPMAGYFQIRGKK